MLASAFRDKDMLKPKGFVEFYSNTSWGKILMGTSLDKYHIGLHHLMYMWKSSESNKRKVKLNIFGYLTKRGDKEFYIKPYTIYEVK